MIVRLFELGDLADVMVLYRQMLAENTADAATFHYPRWDETTPMELGAQITQAVLAGAEAWIGCVAVVGKVRQLPDGTYTGGRVKGMAFGSIYRRRVGSPKVVGHADLLYVDPKFRGGRGRNAIGVRLLRLLWTEAHRRAPEGLVIEGSYVPGSHGERMWTRLGARPYCVNFALTDAEGNPRTEDLFRGHGAPVSTMRKVG